MKKCFKCNVEKELSQFYKHKKMADGHLNKCKYCTKKDVAKRLNYKMKYESDFSENEKKRHREKYHRLNYKDKHKPSYEQKKKIMDRYYKKYPERKLAKNKTASMKPKKEGNQLHHWSYNYGHLKDVIELSLEEHNIIHRFLNYNQRRKMYEDMEGNILNTREKHEQYIESILLKESA